MASKGLSKREFGAWIIPHDALQRVGDVTIGITPGRTIIDRLKGGLIVAVAERAALTDSGDHPVQRKMFEIPPRYWDWLISEEFWNTSEVTFAEPPPPMSIIERQRYHRCYSIRFDPEGISSLIASLPKKQPAPSSPSKTSAVAVKTSMLAKEENKGGRPRKEFWDDLLIAMFTLMFEGDLQPANPAAIETAMLDWAERRRFSLSETSVKEPAKKLFKAYKSGVKN